MGKHVQVHVSRQGMGLSKWLNESKKEEYAIIKCQHDEQLVEQLASQLLAFQENQNDYNIGNNPKHLENIAGDPIHPE